MQQLSDDFRAMAAKVFKNVPYIKLLGIELAELEIGTACLELAIRDELRQPHGLLHGGATASLIDTAMAFAVVTSIGEEETASTVDLNVHYLRPARNGKIVCRAKVVKNGRRLLTVSAEVFDENDKMIATALSTYTRV